MSNAPYYSASTPMAYMNPALLKKLLSMVFLCLASYALAQTAAPAFPDPGKVSMSRENQRALGLKAAAEVYKQMPVLPDSSPETQYVRKLGEKLVATIPAEYSWPFEFHVVAQKEINAFALPGGPMFVNVGTITAAANEAELAGVMAHEMSHVYMQHSAKQAKKSETTNLLAGIASMAAGMTVGNMGGGLVGELSQAGIQMGAQGIMLKYSRTDESQADAVGAVILYKAGYNPQALADFFKTLETSGGSTPPQWLSDHPNPGNRQEAIQNEIKDWPPKNYTSDSPLFAKTRQHALGVKAYTGEEIAQGVQSGRWASLNQSNGATFTPAGSGKGLASAPTAASGGSPHLPEASLQSVMPSRSMVNADLGPVKLQHPENWTVTMPQQQGQFVTIAPQAGLTPNGVGYGALLNGVGAAQVQRMTIDQITAQLIQQMQRDNAMESLGNAQPITVGGIEGRSAMMHSPSPLPNAKGESQKERDWLVTVPQRDGAVILIIFVAPEADFARFQPTYEAMLKSMQFR